jgi:lysophospholipase L1-like esterase
VEQPQQNIHPLKTLALVGMALTPLLALMGIWDLVEPHLPPKFPFRFVTWSHYFAPREEAANIDDILADLDEPDTVQHSTKVVSRQQALADSLRRAGMKLQYPNGDKSILHPFFAALEASAAADKPLHVLHYGDSQIEGDRMTGVIRNELQSRFGGSGPGLVPVVPAVPSFAIKQEHSDSWTRYTGFGSKNPAVAHNRYGPLISFSRFSPLVSRDSTEEYIGWMKMLPNSGGYGRNRNYNRVRLLYGHNTRPVVAQVFADGALLATDTLPASEAGHIKTWNLGTSPQELTVILRGSDSPDVYAASLETSTGVIVDNVAMRGNSGTSFGAVDGTLLSQMYADLNTKLLILQYGGNTVPYIGGVKEANNYGESFKNQINLLKRLIPGVSVIVIGPADMSTKEGDAMVTHPAVEPVRDALRKAAFDAGAAYFDLYTVMGGRNSMPAWVNSNPPLAAPDYIHYSPAGAKKVAEAFIKSLMEDYEAYRKSSPEALP